MCIFPHQDFFIVPFFLNLSLMAIFVELEVWRIEGITASHILLSQRPDPKEKQVINLDQDVQVCGFFFGGWCMNSFV